MDARTREGLGWGLVGALAFLTLAIGYLLVAERAVPIPALLAISVVVFLAAAGSSYVLRPRVDPAD